MPGGWVMVLESRVDGGVSFNSVEIGDWPSVNTNFWSPSPLCALPWASLVSRLLPSPRDGAAEGDGALPTTTSHLPHPFIPQSTGDVPFTHSVFQQPSCAYSCLHWPRKPVYQVLVSAAQLGLHTMSSHRRWALWQVKVFFVNYLTLQVLYLRTSLSTNQVTRYHRLILWLGKLNPWSDQQGLNGKRHMLNDFPRTLMCSLSPESLA